MNAQERSIIIIFDYWNPTIQIHLCLRDGGEKQCLCQNKLVVYLQRLTKERVFFVS